MKFFREDFFIVRFIGSIIKLFIWLSVILIAAGAALFWFDTGSWLVRPLAERAGNFFLAPMKLEINSVEGSLYSGYTISGLKLSSGDRELLTLDYASVSPDWDLVLQGMDGIPFVKLLDVRGVSSDMDKVNALTKHFSSPKKSESTATTKINIPKINPANISLRDVNFATPYAKLALSALTLDEAGRLTLDTKIISRDNVLPIKTDARINFSPLEILSSKWNIGQKSTAGLSGTIDPLKANVNFTALSVEELMKFAPPINVKASGRVDGRISVVSQDGKIAASGVVSMPRANIMDIPLNFRLPFRWNGNNFIALDDASLNTSAASLKLNAEADISSMAVKAQGEAQNISLSEIGRMFAPKAGLKGEGGYLKFDVDTVLKGDILSSTQADINAKMPSVTAAGLNIVRDLIAHVKLTRMGVPKISLGGQVFGGKLFARGEAVQDRAGNIKPQAVVSVVNMDVNTLVKTFPALAKSIKKPSGKVTARAVIFDTLNVDGRITSDKLTANGYTLNNIIIDTNYNNQKSTAELENFTANFRGAQLTASGNVDLKTSAFTANVEARNVDSKYIPELKDLAGTYTLKADASGKYTDIDGVKANVNLTGKNAGYSGMSFGNLEVPLTYANNILTINSARTSMPGGVVNLRGTVNLKNTANPVLDLAASTNNLNIAGVMQNFNVQNDKMPVSGKLNANILVKGPVKTANVTAALKADNVKAGEIVNMPSLEIAASGNMQKVNVNKLTAKINGADLNGTGNITMNQKSFSDSKVNVNMNVKHFDLKPTLTAAGVNVPVTGNVDGRMTLTGTVSQPALNVNVNSVTYDNKYIVDDIALRLRSPGKNHYVVNTAATLNGFRPEIDIDLMNNDGIWAYTVDTKPVDIDRALTAQTESLSGIVKGYVTVNVQGSTKENSPINVTAKSNELDIIDKLKITNITLPVTYSPAKNAVDMTRGLAFMNDGVINTRVHADLKKSSWEGHVNVAHLNFGKLAAPFLPEGELVGSVTGEASMKGGFGVMPISFANGRFTTTPGYFHKMDIIDTVSPTKKISFEKIAGTFFWNGSDLFLNPGTGATAGSDEPLYRYFTVNGAMGIPGKGLKLVCDGRFDLKILDQLLGAMKGVFQYMTGGLTQSVLRDAAGRVLGIKKKDFQNVSFTLANSWQNLSLLNLKITKPIEDFLPIDRLNKDQEEQKDDTQFTLRLKIPTGAGVKSVEEESAGDQFKQQLIDNLFNIGF